MTGAEIDELETIAMKAYQRGNGSEIKKTVSIIEEQDSEDSEEDTRMSLSFIQQDQQPDIKKGFDRATLMPTFNINQCDLLGFKTDSVLLLKLNKNAKKKFTNALDK